MKHTTIAKSLLTVTGILFVVGAAAKTDVQAKIVQLRENTESSKANLKQYEENLKTVNTNLTTAEKALKELEKQKLALSKQTAETNKGKMNVDSTKKQIEGFMNAEKMKLEAERKQIEELKKTLMTLENNAMKREENLVKYQEKMSMVDTELAAWSERNQSIVELEGAIKEKETLAKADQKKLAEKKAEYEEEVSKWKKQLRVSERSYENFSKLK